MNYSWPGQIRQLKNIIHALVVTTKGKSITAATTIEEIQMIDSTFVVLPAGQAGPPHHWE